MMRLWPIVKREYLERVRTRWFLIATLFAPLFFALFIGVPTYYAIHNASERSAVSILIILDATAEGLGSRVARVLSENPDNDVPDVRIVRPNTLARAERLAVQDVTLRRASGYLVLDTAAASEHSVLGHTVRYAGRRDRSDTEMRKLVTAIRTAVIDVRLTNRGWTPVKIDSVTTFLPPLKTAHISDTTREENPSKMLFATFVAFFLYMSIMLFGQSMLSGVIEEKTTRVSEVVLSSVRPETLLAGKVIGVSAVGLTQQIIWIFLSILLVTAGQSLFASAPGSNHTFQMVLSAAANVSPAWLVLVVLYFIFGFIFYGSLYAAVGATVSTEADARQAAQPVVMLLLATILLIQPVIATPDSALSITLSILPFSAPVIMPLRMALTQVSSTEVAVSLIALALGCAAAVWLAARIYRIGLLMYGKRPTLPELVRWIRTA
jgi:ABC-2 type transport system permease protein